MSTHKSYCVINFNSEMVFEAEVAMKLFPLLCTGEPLTYDWNDKVYKRRKLDGYDNGLTIKQFTTEQYALLALNSDNE